VGDVRVHLDIERDAGGRVIGHISTAAGATARFCGWLELLQLLEDHADENTPLNEVGGYET
jgi:hypothetical protein